MRCNIARFDANENVFLGRELESLDPRDFMTLFAGLLARRFVPTIPGIDPVDEVYSYVMYTVTGKTKSGAPGKHARNLPLVNVTKKKTSRTIKSIPGAYQWTIDEIRAAAKKQVPLERISVQAAMTMITRAMDDLIAFGEDGSDITGLLNDASVDNTTTPVTKTGGGTAWSDASQPAEWIADVNKLIEATRTRLQQASEMNAEVPAFDRFTILLPQKHYAKLAETPRSTTSDTSALKWLLNNNPWIESIEEWWKCGVADSGDPRMVCYPRNEMAVGAVVPIDFESFNPQEEGLDILVPCRGKCGGVVMRYPVAVSYMDDI
jgi:hypothetical protein